MGIAKMAKTHIFQEKTAFIDFVTQNVTPNWRNVTPVSAPATLHLNIKDLKQAFIAKLIMAENGPAYLLQLRLKPELISHPDTELLQPVLRPALVPEAHIDQLALIIGDGEQKART